MLTDPVVIQLLAWTAVATGAALIALLSWIALRALSEQREDRIANEARHKENLSTSDARHQDVVKHLDTARERTEARYTDLKASQQQENQRFGQQLAGVQDLVIKEIHQLDLRITRVEVWAEGGGLKKRPLSEEDK